MAVSQIVKEAWRTNDGMNTVLLEHLTPEMLKLKAPDNNWSVAGYLAHLAASKKCWGTHVNFWSRTSWETNWQMFLTRAP